MKKPLLEALKKYLQQEVYPLHSPGHKGGRGFDEDLLFLLNNGTAIDIKDLNGAGNPQPCLVEAQKLASKLYGSDACFWCVNGSTQAVQALILGTLRPGEKLLIQRNSHISVFNGAFLARVEMTYLTPEFNKDFGICTQLKPEVIDQALTQDKEIKAVLITSPNCYGITADTSEIATVCHKHHVPLLVDSTHGAHFGFSEQLPKSALRCGADGVVLGTHKTLNALTQCSMLHIKGKLLDAKRISDALNVLATAEPNYLLLASLDHARAQMEAQGERLINTACDLAAKLREAVKISGLRILTSEDIPGFQLDKTKILINTTKSKLNGIELAAELRKNRIAVEMADTNNILLLATGGDNSTDFYDMLMRLRKVLTSVKVQSKIFEPKEQTNDKPPKAKKAMDYFEAFDTQQEQIPLQKSEGRIATESIIFSSHGVPVLLPGEIISQEILNYIQKEIQLGRIIKGQKDNNLEKIWVVKQ